MRLFKKTPIPPRETPEKEERKWKRDQARLAHERLLELAKDDPAAMAALIEKTFGVKIKPKEPKTLQQRIIDEALEEDEGFRAQVKEAYLAEQRGGIEDLEGEIDRLARDKLLQDPDFRERAITRRIRDIDNKGSAASELLALLDTSEELKERFGGGGGKGLAGILEDKQVMLGVLKLVTALVAPQTLTQERTYVVVEDGQVKELSAEEFQRYQDRLRRSLKAPEIPGDKEEEALGDKEEEAAMKKKVDSLLEYMEGPPEDFVYALTEQVKKKDPQAILVFNFLTTMSVQDMIKNLEPLKDDPVWSSYIKRINDKDAQEWIGEVQELLKTKETSGKR